MQEPTDMEKRVAAYRARKGCPHTAFVKVGRGVVGGDAVGVIYLCTDGCGDGMWHNFAGKVE